MSSPTKTYRIYCFDAAHRVLTADLIDAASDEEAIARAEAKGFGSKCEIWGGRRLVAELDDRRQQA